MAILLGRKPLLATPTGVLADTYRTWLETDGTAHCTEVDTMHGMFKLNRGSLSDDAACLLVQAGAIVLLDEIS